ncbi:hypothetical protein AWE51_08730 [Aquimarina aggregata]|uniref:Uncharacterized protein n=1 Tax=Aquimarina aggregata TaxID=1642818 RepID=A0A162ZDE5_9FLAO|nr:tetratricopeptide repeat protein [Aquimarina aggregata]KZS39726.1 hypothetical protein AWE51_08730 [Aquimarina aggregata]
MKEIKVRKWEWKKRLVYVIVSLVWIILILGIIFNQLVYGVIFHVGYSNVYYGNNDRGNWIMNYAISKKKNPDGQIYHALSVQNTKNGNYNVAIEALEKAYKIKPKEAGAYYGWVSLYYYRDYEKALSILNEYDDSTPNFSDAPMGECVHYLKGLAYMQLENYELAINEFNISIKNTSRQNGEDWVSYLVFLNKGRCLLKLKKYNEAILYFKKSLSNYDKCAEAYYFIGISELGLQESQKACENFNIALELIKKGYKSSDLYVELFHEIYEQQVAKSILNNCAN